jgi:hypothetical protein
MYICIYTRARAHTHTHMGVCVHINKYVCMDLQLRPGVRKYACICLCVCMPICKFLWKQKMVGCAFLLCMNTNRYPPRLTDGRMPAGIHTHKRSSNYMRTQRSTRARTHTPTKGHTHAYVEMNAFIRGARIRTHCTHANNRQNIEYAHALTPGTCMYNIPSHMFVQDNEACVHECIVHGNCT